MGKEDFIEIKPGIFMMKPEVYANLPKLNLLERKHVKMSSLRRLFRKKDNSI